MGVAGGLRAGLRAGYWRGGISTEIELERPRAIMSVWLSLGPNQFAESRKPRSARPAGVQVGVKRIGIDAHVLDCRRARGAVKPDFWGDARGRYPHRAPAVPPHLAIGRAVMRPFFTPLLMRNVLACLGQGGRTAPPW